MIVFSFLHCISVSFNEIHFFQDPPKPTTTLVFRTNPLSEVSLDVFVNNRLMGTESSIIEGVALLMACFYVLQLQYPKSGKEFLYLVQVGLLKLPLQKGEKLPAKVSTFINLVK